MVRDKYVPQLTTEQARETAMHRQMVSQFQVAQELSQQQHADLRARFQHLMHDNEALMSQAHQVGTCPTTACHTRSEVACVQVRQRWRGKLGFGGA